MVTESYRDILQELQEEFDMIKVEKENLERNNALVLRENEKLKSDIQELTQKLEKREIADAESRQRTMAEKQSSTVSDGTQSDNTVPGTSGLDASYLVSFSPLSITGSYCLTVSQWKKCILI